MSCQSCPRVSQGRSDKYGGRTQVFFPELTCCAAFLYHVEGLLNLSRRTVKSVRFVNNIVNSFLHFVLVCLSGYQ